MKFERELSLLIGLMRRTAHPNSSKSVEMLDNNWNGSEMVQLMNMNQLYLSHITHHMCVRESFPLHSTLGCPTSSCIY